jgi:DNA-binding NarL/FixJ family response regulator
VGIIDVERDWCGLVRSLYEPALAWSDWGERVVGRASSLIDHAMLGVQVLALRSDGGLKAVELFSVDKHSSSIAKAYEPVLRRFDPESVRSYCFPRRSIQLLSDALGGASAFVRAETIRVLPEIGAIDGVAVVAHPEPGRVVSIFVMTRGACRLSPSERGVLTRLGLHLESSVRLHRRPETLVAVVGPGGRLEHLRDGKFSGQRYRDAAQLLRSGQGRNVRGVKALDLYRGLVDGGLSAVERRIGSRVFVYFLENPPHRQPLHALSQGEQDVLSLVCHGHSAKAAAYALGIADATVSVRLKRAANKIGLSSRIELVRVAAMLACDPRARFAETALTTSERDVVELLKQGLTNRQIAQVRSRSVRTIANQVAALLRKTGTSNRKSLAAAIGPRPDD